MIAEVDQHSVLNRDPHYIDNTPQIPTNGFNKSWMDWTDIDRMMNICERYLHRGKYRLLTLNYSTPANLITLFCSMIE